MFWDYRDVFRNSAPIHFEVKMCVYHLQAYWPKLNGSERKKIREFLLLSRIVTHNFELTLNYQSTEHYWLYVDQYNDMDDFDILKPRYSGLFA